jgi:hypothetical protein
MDAIELTESETTALCDVVQNYLSELHSEISHTDDRDFSRAFLTSSARRWGHQPSSAGLTRHRLLAIHGADRC